MKKFTILLSATLISLTSLAKPSMSDEFSNGAKIYFRSNDRIYAMDLTNGNVNQIVASGAIGTTKISGDGTRVLSASTYKFKIFEVATGNKIFEKSNMNACGGNGTAAEINWDGSAIYYVKGDKGGTEIWKIDVSTKNETKIFTSNEAIGAEGEFCMSKDENRFVGRYSNNNAVYVDVSHNNEGSYYDECSPCISPDGTRCGNNNTGHTTFEVFNWPQGGGSPNNWKTINSQVGSWDNHTWSNHNDYVIDYDGKIINVVTENSWDANVNAADYIDLWVNNNEVEVTGVSLNKTSLTLDEATSETLIATVSPSGATNKTVTWSSDNENAATVDNNGKVVALDPGTAIITVTTQDGGHTATCEVTVNNVVVPVTDVILNKSSLILSIGSSETLVATVEPAGADDKTVSWSSDKESVATVDQNGVVTAESIGTANITVTTNDGNKTDVCNVTVSSTITYEGEDYTSQSGCSITNSYPGYSGTGSIDYGGNGSYIEWNNVTGGGGEALLTFRYASGSSGNRPCDVIINGNNVGTIDFVPTGSFSTWEETNLNVTLNSGNNTIRLMANSSSGGPNFDKMDVTDKTSVNISSFDNHKKIKIWNTRNLLHIENSQGCVMKIVDASGKVYTSKVLLNKYNEYDMSGHPTGLYIIQIAGKQVRHIKKIVKH